MVAACKHNLKLKSLNAELFVLLLEPLHITARQQGTCDDVFSPVQNRILMVHPLSLLEGMLTPLFKSTMMYLKGKRNPVINKQYTDKFVYK